MPLLFGPVLSRRLGRSLGIDLVPRKTCNMDCLYCEVGRTNNYTAERAPYIPFETIKLSIERALDLLESFDVLTITGSGEPTLNIHFEKALSLAKALIPKPVTVLTNSSLVHVGSVRSALAKADFVLASLDSARERSFRLLNRPLPEVRLEDIIEGLRRLKGEMRGELWLEVLLVKGLNDSQEDIEALREAISYICPHRVQLNTVVRPPAYPMAKPLSREELERVRENLSLRAEVIEGPKDTFLVSGSFTEEEVLGLLISYLARRPADLEELSQVFSENEDRLRQSLEVLERQGKVSRVQHEARIYFRAKSS